MSSPKSLGFPFTREKTQLGIDHAVYTFLDINFMLFKTYVVLHSVKCYEVIVKDYYEDGK